MLYFYLYLPYLFYIWALYNLHQINFKHILYFPTMKCFIFTSEISIKVRIFDRNQLILNEVWGTARFDFEQRVSAKAFTRTRRPAFLVVGHKKHITKTWAPDCAHHILLFTKFPLLFWLLTVFPITPEGFLKYIT